MGGAEQVNDHIFFFYIDLLFLMMEALIRYISMLRYTENVLIVY